VDKPSSASVTFLVHLDQVDGLLLHHTIRRSFELAEKLKSRKPKAKR
jgi:hypothetical protein